GELGSWGAGAPSPSRLASGMYSRLAGWVKSGGATGSSLAVPGTVARAAVVDWVFCGMRLSNVPDRGARFNVFPEFRAFPGVLGLLFDHVFPAPIPRAFRPLRRRALVCLRRPGAAHVRPGPPRRPVGPAAGRALAAGVGDLEAHQHRDFTGGEGDRARRSGAVLLPVRGALVGRGLSRAGGERDRRAAAVPELRWLPAH